MINACRLVDGEKQINKSIKAFAVERAFEYFRAGWRGKSRNSDGRINKKTWRRNALAIFRDCTWRRMQQLDHCSLSGDLVYALTYENELFQSCWLQQWACTNDSSLYDKKFGINNDSNKETKNLAFAIIMDGGPSKSNHPVTLPTPFMKRQWKIWICKNQRKHAKSTEEPEKYKKKKNR